MAFTGKEGKFLLVHSLSIKLRQGVRSATEGRIHGSIHLIKLFRSPKKISGDFRVDFDEFRGGEVEVESVAGYNIKYVRDAILNKSLLVMFFISRLAEINRVPFNLPEVKDESVAGLEGYLLQKVLTTMISNNIKTGKQTPSKPTPPRRKSKIGLVTKTHSEEYRTDKSGR
ncbi:hypothetical protein HAX54_014821, partial [Datura stramonium]|nr:hypothetical protein [Datura stramonium]